MFTYQLDAKLHIVTISVCSGNDLILSLETLELEKAVRFPESFKPSYLKSDLDSSGQRTGSST